MGIILGLQNMPLHPKRCELCGRSERAARGCRKPHIVEIVAPKIIDIPYDAFEWIKRYGCGSFEE